MSLAEIIYFCRANYIKETVMKKTNLTLKTILFVCLATLFNMSADAQLAKQDLNAPFGWANCSSATNGEDYTVTGGGQSDNRITLTSTGSDMRKEISDALKKYDVIVLDGSAGDFILSSAVDMNGLENKTIVGINGARLCTQFYITKEIRAALNKANVMSVSSSSGTGGTLSNGETIGEERELRTRQALIDFTGDATEAYRKSGILGIKRCNNIIVRNIKFVGPGSCDLGGSDLISATYTTHLWVDHCDFMDGMDGNFDITNESDFITVSWCTFSYTKRSYDHMNTNLIGSNDKRYDDVGKLHVTIANCIWGSGCAQRMPMVRFGTVHLLNNYYDCMGNKAAINPRFSSSVLIDNNYFAPGVKKIFKENDAKAYTFIDNRYTEKFTQPSDRGRVTVPYIYKAVYVADVPGMVMSKYGAGAKLKDPLKIGR